MSTVRKNKKKENALNASDSASVASSSRSFKSFLSRMKSKGRQKVTIMLVPHTEKKVLNVQLSFFSLWGILALGAIVICAFVFSAVRFSDTANKLQSRSSDLATTQADLDAIRRQTKELIVSARRFDSALTGSLDTLGSKVGAAAVSGTTVSAAGQSAVAAPMASPSSAKSDVDREVGELKRVTDYLEDSVDPLKSLGSLLQSQSTVLAEIPNIWPVRGRGHIELYYGQNENPFTGQWYLNKGVDISTYRSGDAVLATANGTVSSLGYDQSLGNYIVIQHEHGFFTRYGNLMAIRVVKGQKVNQGQIIGLLGNTGVTTGPRLHYEVHVGTGVIDPVKFLNLRATAVAAE